MKNGVFLKLHPFRQSSGLCGPAAMKIVFHYYGVHMTEKELARLAESDADVGTSAEAMIRTAKHHGFKAFKKDNATFAEIKNLLKKGVPVIVDFFSVDEGHYAVVRGIDTENIYLEDPELGHSRALKLNTFKRIWFDFPKDYIRKKNELILRRIIVIQK